MKEKFYICRHCRNLISIINSSGVPVMCCGEKMEELKPNTVDASKEKHIPIVTIKGDSVHVNVGEVTHPMTDEHYIQWIYIECENGSQYKTLKPEDAPEATFCISKDNPIAVYAYCNIHGLWKTEL